MAVDYATYLYNHIPNKQGIAPVDIFFGSRVPKHKLCDLHVWGCPMYVLDPTLQQGKKLPRWEPRSCRGIFVGFSPNHSSNVPLVLNLTTGSISPQFHVVFDDEFSSVDSMVIDETPPSFWNEFDIEAHTLQIPLDRDSNAVLSDEWLSASDLEERSKSFARSNEIRRNFIPSSSSNVISDYPSASTQPLEEQHIIPLEDQNIKSLEEPPSSILPGSKVSHVQSASPSKSTSTPKSSIISNIDTPSASSTALRRSTRINKGIKTSTDYINEVFLSSMETDFTSSQQEFLAYQAELSTDLDSGIIDCMDPRVYLTKSKLKDPDQPSFLEAMHSHDSDKWVEAMKREISDLLARNTWKRTHRKDFLRDKNGRKYTVLKSIWVLNFKRLPDGTPDRYKARFCVRGDLQKEGISDAFFFLTGSLICTAH